MPRQKKTESPINNREPAAAAEGINPPIAKVEKLYIKYLNNLLE